MTPQDFQLAVMSAGVLINLPLLAWMGALLWKLDVRLARVEIKIDMREDKRNG